MSQTTAPRSERDGPPPLPTSACLAPGYVVVNHLRRGSLLDVYDVWSQERRCRCVAKLLRPDCASEVAGRRRVLREGRLLVRLSHPHIVRAYEVLTAPQPMIILETLTDATLEYLVGQVPAGLRLADVAILGTQLCSAAHYLHARGLLHLDLKPANIVCERGMAKLLDLDIARPPGCGRKEGTRQYMAPEQVRGAMLSAATDVWGIGLVLFEAATGQLPFDFHTGPKYPQLHQRARGIGSYRRVPAALAQAITGALDPEPDRRPTIDALAALLHTLV